MVAVSRLVEGGDLPHLLLYGPPGTGKTSTIFALAKQIYGKNFKSMILEVPLVVVFVVFVVVVRVRRDERGTSLTVLRLLRFGS